MPITKETATGLSGGCLCRQVRYLLEGQSLFVSQCCCRDCQKATGTGHTTVIGVRRGQLQISGQLKTYTTRGESGGKVSRHFCGVCGGRIYTSGDMPGSVVLLQAGSLDEPSAIAPETVIYMRDVASWDRFDERLPKYAVMQPFDVATVETMQGK